MSICVCNTCGYIETPESPEIEGGFCPNGHDDWLEIGDPVKVVADGEFSAIKSILLGTEDDKVVLLENGLRYKFDEVRYGG
ncbi:hypothetical protein [Neptuniibacter sp. QD37_11]|uniref:hypothetical protein n=1 Tax=Neptuniibacter sp. QD37_11 TaxID=3398209 RepID=UPI0039F5593F